MRSLRNVCILLASFMLMGSGAEAGVKGGAFAGTFTNNFQLTAISTLNFDNSSGLALTQQFGFDEVRTFTGNYNEVDFFIISLWSGQLLDDSPNGSFNVSGLGIFGIMTTMHLDNGDALISADGFYFKSGSAARTTQDVKSTNSGKTIGGNE